MLWRSRDEAKRLARNAATAQAQHKQTGGGENSGELLSECRRYLAISVPMDDRTAWLARHYRDITSDYEDASVLASCELCKANYLVTHDKRLAARADIATKTATEMADLITRAHGE